MDAAMVALTCRSNLDLPFASAAAPSVEYGDASLAPPPDDVDSWETTGADVAQHLLDAVIDPDEPLTIIGGDAEDVAELKRRYGLQNVRWRAAPAQLKHNPDAVLAIAEFAAAQESRFIFVCAGGAQQQQALACAIAHCGKSRGVGLCVAASLDALCGRSGRAPPWLRELGLEWLHRLVRQPPP
jgi:exopolysaccharide biosynthesis WecB/TagA/CpsF family protein